MYTKSFLISLHKKAHGYVCSPRFWGQFLNASLPRQQVIIARLAVQAKKTEANRAEYDSEKRQEFNEKIIKIVELGAKSRKQAMKWLADSEGFESVDYMLHAYNIPVVV